MVIVVVAVVVSAGCVVVVGVKGPNQNYSKLVLVV